VQMNAVYCGFILHHCLPIGVSWLALHIPGITLGLRVVFHFSGCPGEESDAQEKSKTRFFVSKLIIMDQ
jgi:hypothetical protein